MAAFKVGVFVWRGGGGWRFRVYTRDFDPSDRECNVLEVEAATGAYAKMMALRSIKARMNLQSRLAPTDVVICKEGR